MPGFSREALELERGFRRILKDTLAQANPK